MWDEMAFMFIMWDEMPSSLCLSMRDEVPFTLIMWDEIV